jgi:hypothetical protein
MSVVVGGICFGFSPLKWVFLTMVEKKWISQRFVLSIHQHCEISTNHISHDLLTTIWWSLNSSIGPSIEAVWIATSKPWSISSIHQLSGMYNFYSWTIHSVEFNRILHKEALAGHFTWLSGALIFHSTRMSHLFNFLVSPQTSPNDILLRWNLFHWIPCCITNLSRPFFHHHAHWILN